jgi:hypothetical protein
VISLVSRLYPVEAFLKGESCEPIEAIAYCVAQVGQTVIRVWMSLEQQADPIVIPGHMTDVLQHRGQSERIITAPLHGRATGTR